MSQEEWFSFVFGVAGTFILFGVISITAMIGCNNGYVNGHAAGVRSMEDKAISVGAGTRVNSARQEFKFNNEVAE